MELENLAMPYETAEGLMKLGKPIALPEWGGFWFFNNGKILVFTKEGEVLDTPDHETYDQRNDWMLPTTNDQFAINVVKCLRVSIDGIRSNLNLLVTGSREASELSTELQYAFMWMGLLLSEIGDQSPYKEAFNVASPVIEKHADTAEAPLSFITALWALPDETARIKQLRKQVSLFIDTLSYFSEQFFFSNVIPLRKPTNKSPTVWAGFEVVTHLINSRLWLGQLLNNIRVREERNDLVNKLPFDVTDSQKAQIISTGSTEGIGFIDQQPG